MRDRVWVGKEAIQGDLSGKNKGIKAGMSQHNAFHYLLIDSLIHSLIYSLFNTDLH